MGKNIIVGALDYPPPPPPPPPQSKKLSSKALIVGLIVVLALVGVAGAYYLATMPTNPNDDIMPFFSPSASAKPTATSASSFSPHTSPQSTSTIPSPSTAATSGPSGQALDGYRLGAWTNYTTKHYGAFGNVTATYNMRYSVNQEIKNGIDCWILQTNTELINDESPMKTITTYWLDKRDLQGIHYKIQIYSNEELISNTENDYAPGDFNDIPRAIDLTTILSQESISVPAGTFNCDKAAITMRDLGKTYVTTVWSNSNIPIIGMVKQDLSLEGVLISSTELVAYDG